MLRVSLFWGLILASLSVSAGDWTDYAIPTKIDLERGKGFMFYGDFGNSMNCTIDNRVYVEIEHPQYKEIYSTVLAAFMSETKVRAYIHECDFIGWYAAAPTTFNILTVGGALEIKH